MKKSFLFAFVFVCALAVKAQDGPRNVVKLNPLGLLFGSANASFEHALNEKSSFQINANFGGLKVGSVKYTAIGGGVDYRAYFSKDKTAPMGFYASPGAGFYSQKVDNGMGDSGSGSGFVIKGVVGNQWIWDSGFALDVFVGVNYYAGGKVKLNGTEYAKFSGVLPALGVSLGFGF